jgi:hypothetical protein
MSARKYSWNELTEAQLDELSAKYPFAVETITIRKPIYKIVSMLLDSKVAVPGITLKERSGDDIDTDRRNDGTPADVPKFIKKKD